MDTLYLIRIKWADGKVEERVDVSTFQASQKAYNERFGLGNMPDFTIDDAEVIGPVSDDKGFIALP